MATQKPIKSLLMDCLAKDQPEGTIRFGKNGIQHYVNGAVFNEPGFVKSGAVLPYKVCGIIETDDKPILFTTNGTNSAIGYFNPARDNYEPILDDRVLDFKLGFSLENYITGEYQRNNKAEVLIAFTDKVQAMMHLNCDAPEVNKFDDMLFFVTVIAPDIKVTLGTSGQLDGGSYRIAVKLLKDDGTETQYLGLTGFTFVAALSSSDTANKSLSIQLTGVDMTYSKVVVAILKQSAGITTAIELDPVGAASELFLTYTGSENFVTITPEELLIPSKTYDRVGTISQLNDTLYIGNLTEAEDIVFQRQANMMGVEFNSTLYDLTIPAEATAIESGEVRGFAHEEIYAFYIRLKQTSGGWTRAFHVPGKELTEDSRTTQAGNNISGKVFQLDDTITAFDASTATGICGMWENLDESYPIVDDESLDQFNSTSIGGPALGGLKVRHHKMPSIKYIKSRLSSRTDQSRVARYGKSVLDILGVRFTGVTIPEELANKLTGQYEILFAKRTQANTTNYGSSLIVYNALKLSDLAAYQSGFNNNTTTPVINTRGRNLISVGGNWQSKAGTFDPDPATQICRESFRMFPYETLANKPDFPDNRMYISVNWKTRTYGERAFPNSREENDAIITPMILVNMDLTETRMSGSTTLMDTSFKNIGVGSLSYMPNNVNLNSVNGVNNIMQEACVLATVNKSAMTADPISVVTNTINLGDHDVVSVVTPKEDNYFVTLKALKESVYKNFNTQALVTTGRLLAKNSTEFLAKGDCFLTFHSFHTYGSFSYLAGESMPWNGLANEGYRVSRTFITESIANLGARYEITGNPYSYWYFRQGNLGFATLFDKNIDPNQVGYNKELNAIPEIQALIFYDNTKIINEFPYRIHRGGRSAREGTQRNWRKFLPLDYYDMPKNLGEIMNLQGMDDKLLIHMENALMVTQDKTKLESDVLSVTLGAGDIFQFTPQDVIGSKLGLAGSTHDLACYRTPFGYVFPDTKLGQLYVFNQGIKLLNGGLNDFLRQFAKVAENNPFIGNGVTVGYDPQFNRILVTVKNKTLDDANKVDGFVETKEFFSVLIPNKSVVYKDGRWQQFLGVNPTALLCK